MDPINSSNRIILREGFPSVSSIDLGNLTASPSAILEAEDVYFNVALADFFAFLNNAIEPYLEEASGIRSKLTDLEQASIKREQLKELKTRLNTLFKGLKSEHIAAFQEAFPRGSCPMPFLYDGVFSQVNDEQLDEIDNNTYFKYFATKLIIFFSNELSTFEGTYLYEIDRIKTLLSKNYSESEVQLNNLKHEIVKILAKIDIVHLEQVKESFNKAFYNVLPLVGEICDTAPVFAGADNIEFPKNINDFFENEYILVLIQAKYIDKVAELAMKHTSLAFEIVIDNMIGIVDEKYLNDYIAFKESQNPSQVTAPSQGVLYDARAFA